VRAAREFDAPVTGTATRTNDIGFFHGANTRSSRRLSCIVDGCDKPATPQPIRLRVGGNMAAQPGLPRRAITKRRYRSAGL
jgi:hypothetical protein